MAIDLELELPDRGVVRGPIHECLDALLAQRQLLNEAVDRELLALKEAPAAQVEDPDRLGDIEHGVRPCDAQCGLPVGNPGLAAELHLTQDVAVKRLRDRGAEPVAVTRGALQRLAGHDEPGLGQLSPVGRGAVGGADQVLGDDQACLRMLRGRGVEEVGGAGQQLVSGEQPLQPGQRGALREVMHRRDPVGDAAHGGRLHDDLGARGGGERGGAVGGGVVHHQVMKAGLGQPRPRPLGAIEHRGHRRDRGQLASQLMQPSPRLGDGLRRRRAQDLGIGRNRPLVHGHLGELRPALRESGQLIESGDEPRGRVGLGEGACGEAELHGVVWACRSDELADDRDRGTGRRPVDLHPDPASGCGAGAHPCLRRATRRYREPSSEV